MRPLKTALLALTLSLGGAHAATLPAVTLTGFAQLPADTLADGPASGAWNGGLRGQTRFQGQPVQGFSGVQFTAAGEYLLLSDNGFGAKNNSADYLLRLYRLSVAPNTAAKAGTGQVGVRGFISLRDPDRRVPWQIVNEATPDRLLTGADFDPEGFVIAPDGTLWIGDEFGPYLLHFSADGRLLDAPIATPNLHGRPTLRGQNPIVIAHRGSSGTRPEHTLESYRVAIEGGADFIEPDLVVTKDGVLVARHEPVMVVLDKDGKVTEATTDVATRPEFKGRVRTKTLDGTSVTGYWVEDFTLAELKTLRAVERLPALRGRAFDGRFEVPTLAEIIALVRDTEARTGRKVGLYPETKHPTYMKAAGFDTSQLLIDTLTREKFTDPARVFIQSFETANLRDLKTRIMPAAGVTLPLVQLVSGPTEAPYDWAASGDTRRYDALTTPEGLRDLATYASGVGPTKRWIITDKGDTTDFVARAHAAGLLVHPWTLRSEPTYLLPTYAGNPEEEMRQVLRAGVDGFFTDFPATGARVAAQLAAPEVRSPQHPAFTQGASSADATLGASGGFEGLALSADGTTLYGLLEKTVTGDLPGQLRLNALNLGTRQWSLAGRYALDAGSDAIGDLATVNDTQYLVLERDNKVHTDARNKRVYLIDLKRLNADGTFQKTLIADLMNIADPQGLAPDTRGGTLTFPYVTIENVIVLNPTTLLIANDNNYPATGGRGPGVKDDTQFLWLRLGEPLNLAPNLGGR
ncbi:glycerophosphodiester phosphodiesterase family protein [Deinococcus soli (ex Cha et al. 2016)]|uniref:glycerophosphodiester phosphodiesterase family protein n=1 Tax=Deinococcus soli (ex Cha et al. 2016) TaxID=1309411 RepID=UPI00166DB738|nr:glycerophosphodiester phosphodiesterase family protein [Deinococcus soli (ex Cha et al. 2016)]GGB59110.1 glycerophosphoryl diester phosphodiesterase [Deinococcus soli (ex Cha et al. 2016)]